MRQSKDFKKFQRLILDKFVFGILRDLLCKQCNSRGVLCYHNISMYIFHFMYSPTFFTSGVLGLFFTYCAASVPWVLIFVMSKTFLGFLFLDFSHAVRCFSNLSTANFLPHTGHGLKLTFWGAASGAPSNISKYAFALLGGGSSSSGDARSAGGLVLCFFAGLSLGFSRFVTGFGDGGGLSCLDFGVGLIRRVAAGVERLLLALKTGGAGVASSSSDWSACDPKELCFWKEGRRWSFALSASIRCFRFTASACCHKRICRKINTVQSLNATHSHLTNC